jgi:hypothetical protein
MSEETAEGDIFDSILDLEEQFYAEGYKLGVADGARAGRIEGRVFGLEKGFEKFLEAGRLHGRAIIWQDQCRNNGNERLTKHVERMFTLVDPEEYVTMNTEEAVNDVDERIRDAKGKERIIKRILGETDEALTTSTPTESQQQRSPTLRVKRNGPASRNGQQSGKRAPTGEMEDFAGLPTIPKKGT